MKKRQDARKFVALLQAFIANEQGATIAEYALVTIFIGLAGMVILQLFPAAIRAYLRRIYVVVSLPFP